MGFLNRLFGRKEEKKPGKQAKPREPVTTKPNFPLGENIISDGNIINFTDLGHYYPLPAGFAYQQDGQGIPTIARLADGKTYSFLIEAEMLTFNDEVKREDGRIGYQTTEVFKQRSP